MTFSAQRARDTRRSCHLVYTRELAQRSPTAVAPGTAAPVRIQGRMIQGGAEAAMPAQTVAANADETSLAPLLPGGPAPNRPERHRPQPLPHRDTEKSAGGTAEFTFKHDGKQEHDSEVNRE